MKATLMAIAFAGVSALCVYTQASDRAVVVFASQKVVGQWLKSYFSAIADGNARLGECEESITTKLGEARVSVAVTPFSQAQQRDARKFRIVFDRYGDVSSMPNDALIKAASIVNPDASAVISCGVITGSRMWRRASIPPNCADVSCKVVDISSKRRMATLKLRSCVDENQAEQRSVSTGLAIVRDACGEMGEKIASKLSEIY